MIKPVNSNLLTSLRTMASPKEFPYEVLGPTLERVIKETHECLQYPKPFMAAAVLSAISAAIGQTREIEVWKDYAQTPCLWIAICGSPGEMKTHPLNWALRPIKQRDISLTKQYGKDYEEYERLKDMSKEERAKEGITGTPREPIEKAFLVDDFTIEKLAALHHGNLRGLTAHVDELAGFLKSSNRYSGGAGEDQKYNKIWNGGRLKVNRKGSKTIDIPRSFVSIVGTIQPGILNELFKDGKEDSGFTARWLFVCNDNPKPRRANQLELSEDTRKAYSAVIDRLLDQLSMDFGPYGDDLQPVTVKQSPEARAIWDKFHDHNEDLRVSAAGEFLQGATAKLEQYCARFALMLQMVYYVDCGGRGDMIEARAMEGAVRITEWFRVGLTTMYNRVTGKDPLTALTEDQRRFLSELPECFGWKEAKQAAGRAKVSEGSIYLWLSDAKGKEGPLIKYALCVKEGKGDFRKLNFTINNLAA